MRGRTRVVLAVLAAACVCIGILFATGTISGARTASKPSPACLPASLDRSAVVAGADVRVSPVPFSDSASPATQVSFLGVPASAITNVAVEGSRSGYHRGRVLGYSQRDGGSFLPDKPFAAGERVSVRALVHRRPLAFSFMVATPSPTAKISAFPNPAAPPSSVQSFVTAPSLHPPILDVTTPDRDPGAGSVLMTTGPGPGEYGPLIYAPDGTLQWFDALPKGVNALDLRVQRYEGRDVLTWWQGKVLVLGFGEGEDLVMNSNYETIATVHAGNGYRADLHDFLLARDEIAYVTVFDVVRCDLSSVGGGRNGVLIDTAVQAIDMKTGLVRWEWHSLDHVGVDESRAPVTKGAQPWDYFHVNSIDVQPNGDVLISARSTWAAYELDAGDGRILWRLGGKKSSFALPAGSEPAWQHDARLQPDGTVTLFDNGSLPRVHAQSRGERFALDRRRRTATLVHTYTHPLTPLLSDSQGNMQTLGSGNVVIGWGATPTVSELTPDGELAYDAHLPPDMSSYRAFRFPWSGRPRTAPSVSARVLATEDQTAVFVSWNGATDVALWRVLAGPDRRSLRARAIARDAAFESEITYPDTYSEHKVEYVAVQALDANGKVLGTSPTVAVAPPPPLPKG
jgi:Arylsulfotransferase (ASST)